jgi:Mrp family chromosome partitioning ATPase
MYRSETLILAEPQKVPTDYAKPTVGTDVTDRLQNIRQEDHSTELLNRDHLQNLLHSPTETLDLMVLNTGAILPVAETQVLGAILDRAILVIRGGHSPYKLVCQAADLLKPKAVGAVLNGVDQIPYERFYYGYYKESEKGQ